MNRIPSLRLTKTRARVSVLLSFLLLLFIFGWLYYEAFIDPAIQKRIAWSNPLELSNILPTRGEIRSADKEKYSLCKEAYLFWVNPSLIDDPMTFSGYVSSIINEKPEKISQFIQDEKRSKKQYVIIKRKLSSSSPGMNPKDEIIKKLDSVNKYRNKQNYIYGFVPDLKREYPKNSVASALIGFTGTDNYGLSGLELSYDNVLRGTPGKQINYNAFIGDQMPGSRNDMKQKKDGDSIVLTINHFLQTKVEAILEKNCKAWNGTGGVAIVMNPKTGAILSLANYPSFNLNEWQDFWDVKKYMNRAISMNFEPGSIFKPITAAAALEEGFITPDTLHNCGRAVSIGGITIECERNHGNGQNLSDILRNSCNVALAKIGKNINKTFFEYAKRFNFGSPILCGLTGQESGILPDPAIWSDSSAATMSFGQGLSVTPMQMITAYSAIVNGGVMMKPMIVKQILNIQDVVVQNFQPESIKKVISSSTAEKLVLALQNVVQDPRSMANARIDGMSIGGKTGTAKQVTNGRYDNDKIVCSFIGFFPVENPQYVILVSIQEPDRWNGFEEAFGSTVSAPAFREIAYWLNLHPVDGFGQ